jgi:hypothetical protein
MNNNDRDTKFAGVAKLLIEDLYSHPNFDGTLFQEGVDMLIAQRLYDFALHIARETVLERDIPGFIEDIPDLTQWPESPTPLPDAPTEQAPSSD